MFDAINRKIKRIKTLKRFGGRGSFLTIGDNIHGHLENVYVGDYTYIGDNVFFNCLLANVLLGNYVIIADDVMFITGNHRFDIIGKRIFEISNKEKRPSDDMNIIIENDVWIGSRAIILKGVRIGEGSIIGAGSVVTKDIPPYSIAVGNPAKVVRARFTPEEIKKHKEFLGE